MAKFLFTMMLANDLGLPTRLVPIARELADRGHEVAIFNTGSGSFETDCGSEPAQSPNAPRGLCHPP